MGAKVRPHAEKIIKNFAKFRYFGILAIYLTLYRDSDIDYADNHHTV